MSTTKVIRLRAQCFVMEESQGARLARLRKAKRLSQAKLGSLVGVGQSAIGNIEANLRGYGKVVVAVAAILDVSPDYLLMETDDPRGVAARKPRPLTLGESIALQIDQIADPGMQNAAFIAAMHAIEDVLSPLPLPPPIDRRRPPADQESTVEPPPSAPRASKKPAKTQAGHSGRQQR